MLMINDSQKPDALQKISHSGYEASAEVAGIVKKPQGFFVEVGAGEGIESSLTGHLEQNGWQGILIEQNIGKCGHCIINRPKAAVLNHKCVSKDFANFSTQQNGSSGEKPFTSSQKGSNRTLSSIFKEFDIESIDLLVINTPDSYADILNGFDFSVSIPEYILIKESPGNKSETRLSSLGYDIINSIKGNSFYRHALYRNRIKADLESKSPQTDQMVSILGNSVQKDHLSDNAIDRLSRKIADIVREEISRFLKEERGIR